MNNQIWVKNIAIFPVRYEGQRYEVGIQFQINEEHFIESIFEKVGNDLEQ